MKFDEMTDYKIATSSEIRKGIEKILNKFHRRYTFESPVYSNSINNTINQYRNGEIDYATAKLNIDFYEKQNQLDFVNLLINGPSVWEHSINVNNAVDKLNYERMNTNYENGIYRDKGYINLTSNININIENPIMEEITVPDITSYLNWLRNEVK